MHSIMQQIRGEPKGEKQRKRTHLYEMQIGLTNERNYSNTEIAEGLREAKAILQQDLLGLPHKARITDYTEGDPPSLGVSLSVNCHANDRAARAELAQQWQEVVEIVKDRLNISQLRSRGFERLTQDTGQGYMRA